MSDDEALEALKKHLAKSLEEMKAVRDFALGFHTGNHRMKRGEKASLLKALAAVRKETVEARDFLTKKWPFPPKPTV
jgi:hypothetical protein